MNIREQVEELGKQLIVLAGLHSDLESRLNAIGAALAELLRQQAETMDEMENEHYR